MVVKWCFCVSGVFVVFFVVVFLWWCFCGGVSVALFLWWCFCGAVLAAVFLRWWWCGCGGVFVFVWWWKKGNATPSLVPSTIPIPTNCMGAKCRRNRDRFFQFPKSKHRINSQFVTTMPPVCHHMFGMYKPT